jgi:hypothetical protein
MNTIRFSTRSSILAVIGLSATLLHAQLPPPGPKPGQPPPAGSYSSASGTIWQLNYGRELEVRGFLIGANTLVTFPPHIGCALGPYLAVGNNVKVDGYATTTITGLQRFDMAAFTNLSTGKTFSLPQPGQFTNYSGSGRITQFNYNNQGEIDGLILDNGVFAKTPPPFSATLRSLVQTGGTVSISGYAHRCNRANRCRRADSQWTISRCTSAASGSSTGLEKPARCTHPAWKTGSRLGTWVVHQPAHARKLASEIRRSRFTKLENPM